MIIVIIAGKKCILKIFFTSILSTQMTINLKFGNMILYLKIKGIVGIVNYIVCHLLAGVYQLKYEQNHLYRNNCGYFV